MSPSSFAAGPQRNSPGYAAALEAARNTAASKAFKIATSNFSSLSNQVTGALPVIEPLLDEIDVETAADPEAALVWAAEDLVETPDGWDAVPLIWSTLAPARRRDLRLRVGALFLAIYIYASALASETDDQEAAKLVSVWMMLAWLYSSVVGAIEDAEEKLK